MTEQMQDTREVEYWNTLTNQMVTVPLTERQTALLVEFGDAVARLARIQANRLEAEGLPMRAAENAIADELQDLIESGFHIDE
jgi:hypothetical protein